MKKFAPQEFLSQGGTLVLREVEKRDCKALNGIMNEPEVNHFVYLPSPVPLESTPKHWRELEKNGGKSVVAELNGKVVGSVELRPRRGREKHVAGFGIAFSQKAQGTGTAQVTLAAALKHAKNNGIEIISASCFADNKRARAFYKKMHFKEVAVLKGYLKRGKKRANSVLIEKRL